MGLSFLSLMLMSIYILSTILKFHLVVANSFQSHTPTCFADEHSALLQFKQSFLINANALSLYDCAYPKTLTWKSNRSCCSWDGVECDGKTGRVIGLDLSSSCLYGSINSSSALFRLVHLERLNLAFNDFNSSQIPSTIRNFPRLRYLNFSSSGFSGRVPSEISHLSKLSSLSILGNDEYNRDQMFSDKGFLSSLAQNLTGLEILELFHINISSSVPETLANLSHLTTLFLDNCSLFGALPFSLGNLNRLTELRLYSIQLSGPIPASFGNLTRLTALELGLNKLSGPIPASFGNLTRLTALELGSNQLSGPIPASFGNLTRLTTLELGSNQLSGPIPASFGNLTRLTALKLGSNQLSGPIPASFGNLTRLTALELGSNQLSGPIPASFGNLNRLTTLRLDSIQLSGPIPALFGNLTRLTVLDLGYNNFNNSIPSSLFNLVNIQYLALDENNLSGTVEFHKFLKLQNLAGLMLSRNKLRVLTGSTSMNNATTVLQKFVSLGLGGCNISEFPEFLRSQKSLIYLDLSGNRLHGRVPKWMWNTSTQTLWFLNISHNFLSDFDRPPSTNIPWVNLESLDLSSNSLVGEIASFICNASTLYMLDLSNNKLSGVLPQCLGNSNLGQLYLQKNNLSGKVSPQICNLTQLSILDLSSNKLSGMLPQCLGPGLEYLNLANNSFHGILPQTFTTASCSLIIIDVSHNQLQGQLPRSLANCDSLQFLVLSNNQFDDVFPLWLGTLQQLKILAMHHNRFYGVIGQPKKNLHFPELRILDLSHNSFRGKFPAEYIFSGYAMRAITSEQRSYDGYDHDGYLECSISITNKGIEIYYPKIQDDLVAIHLSGNKFEGNIPEFIGKLKSLRLLNISNNLFTGSIPSSFANLTVLESLDLSQNQLSGEIPQQLSQLSFLEKFNVSHNYLTGRIPSGNQLSTFDVTSYEGNPGLCGDPLPKKCENAEAINLPPSSTNTEGSGIEVDWKFVLAGLGSGLVVGVVLADVAVTRWDEWFLEIVDMLIRLVKRMRRFRK